VVAASKILHFLAPARFPIWDSRVAKMWGRLPNGPRAPEHYLDFTTACHHFSTAQPGRQACNVFRRRAAQAGYTYPMTDMRAIELILFLKQ
jgi:hypothetical protein